MGKDKFYVYSGRVETLPCTLHKFVFNNINTEQMFQIVSGTNEAFNEVWWFYPSKNSSVNDSYVIYNYAENVWYYGTLNRSAWLDSALRDYPMAAFSVQNSFLSADITEASTSITLLNGNSYPDSGTVIIDNEEITYAGRNGNTLYGCLRGVNSTSPVSHVAYSTVTYKTSNQIMYHEYGTDDGSESVPRAIDSYIDTSDYDIGDGHNYALVWRVLPDMSFEGSSANVPRVFLTVVGKNNSGSTFRDDTEMTVERGPTVPIEQYTGQVFTRVRGRQMKFRLFSNEVGVTWKMGAMRIDVRADGRR